MTKEQERLLNVARGCFDYLGGYSDAGKLEIFHHGVETVLNALVDAVDNSQSHSARMLEVIGMQDNPIVHELRKEVETLRQDLLAMRGIASRRGEEIERLKAMTPEKADQHSLRDLLDGQREILDEIRKLKRNADYEPDFIRLLEQHNKLKRQHEELKADYRALEDSGKQIEQDPRARAKSLRELVAIRDSRISSLTDENRALREDLYEQHADRKRLEHLVAEGLAIVMEDAGKKFHLVNGIGTSEFQWVSSSDDWRELIDAHRKSGAKDKA